MAPPTGLDGNVQPVTTQWVQAPGVAAWSSEAGRENGESRVPPAANRIAGEARLEPEERLSGPILLGIAAVLGLLAVGLGSWAFVSLDARARTVRQTVTVTRSSQRIDQALPLLASPSTERIPLAHSVGRIVLAVDPRGRALLVVHDLGKAPAGKSYQAWVIPPGKTVPVSAAVFGGAEPVVILRPAVARGAVVAVTLERDGGATRPSHAPRLVAKRAA